MISLDNAYKNIVKDEGWIKNYLILVLIFLVGYIIPGFFYAANPAPTETASAQQIMSSLIASSVSSVFSIIGSIIFYGYNAIYLRNMMADKNAPILNIKLFFKDILGAGLKIFAGSLIYILTIYLGVIIIGLILALLFWGNIKIILPICILLLLILVLGLCIYFPLITINYSANNCKFSSLFDFKRATKYLTKDYWKVILLCAVFLIAIYIIMAILMLIFFLAGIKVTNNNFTPLMLYAGLIISPISAFWTLIYNNLLAQIYYSKVEEK